MKMQRRVVGLVVVLGTGVVGLSAPPTAAREDPAAAAPVAAASAQVAQRRLVLTVTGGGRAVADAEVLFSSESAPDKRLFTDDKGRVTWAPPAVPKVQVRIIAAGWKTHHGELAVSAEQSQHTVQLKPMPAANPTEE